MDNKQYKDINTATAKTNAAGSKNLSDQNVSSEHKDSGTGNLNPLFDPSTDNREIRDEVQEMLNKPQAGGKLSEEDRAFLDTLVKLVDEGKIKLYQPSSLLNMQVYESLSQEAKAKADQNAVLMLAKIREIIALEKIPNDTNYQERNLIKALRLNKERVESEAGDVFII